MFSIHRVYKEPIEEDRIKIKMAVGLLNVICAYNVFVQSYRRRAILHIEEYKVEQIPISHFYLVTRRLSTFCYNQFVTL